MKISLAVFAVSLFASLLFAAPGDIIGSPFSFGIVRGLDRDWSDGNIWMTTAVSNNCKIGKFNATTHAQVSGWVTAAGQYWCYDCGYGYKNSGTNTIVLVDDDAPRMRMYNPTTGAYIGSLPDAFPEYQYEDGVAVYAGGSITNTNLWATSYNGNPIKKSDYPVTTWTSFATTPATPATGCCFGYGYGVVLVATTSPDFKIYCFNANNGTLTDTWSLSGWSYYLMGMAAGRVDAVGNNESVFIAEFTTNSIREVEIGDVFWGPPISVEPTSLGMIKAAFH